MQTGVFVQIWVLDACKYTHYWCDEAAYSPPTPCPPPLNTYLSSPNHDVERGDEEGTSPLPKGQQGRSWMQEKPPRNEAQQCLTARLYGLMPYHNNGKICARERKNGQSATAEDFNQRQKTDAGLKLSKLPFAFTGQTGGLSRCKVKNPSLPLLSETALAH